MRWMRSLTAALALAAVLAPASHAAAPGPEALVEAEHAFAKDCATTSVRDGFLKWLAPTGVVFSPGPVNARKLYAARPAGVTRLSWEPEVAVMSAEGELGWTTGPWQWRKDSTVTEPQATGTFVTLWKRQTDQTYRAVLDIGVSHDAVPATPMESRTLAAVGGNRGALAQRKALWKADADYCGVASKDGLAAALAGAAAPNVRWLRDGARPVIGRDAARDSAAAAHPQGRMMSLAQFVADTGDLGYTYGTLVEGSAADPDSSYFLHIWERTPAQPWALVLEMFSPVPKRTK